MAEIGANYQIATAGAQFEFMTGRTPRYDNIPGANSGLIGTDLTQRRFELDTSVNQEVANWHSQLDGQYINANAGIIGGASGYRLGSMVNSTGSFIGYAHQAVGQYDALSKAYNQRSEFYVENGPYRQSLDRVHTLNYGRLTAAANENKTESIKASNALARDVTGSYNKAYNLTLDGNNINFRGSIDAAKVVQNASLDAARLHYNASIISELGRTAAKDIEQALTLRY
jgi:hypothetical protein